MSVRAQAPQMVPSRLRWRCRRGMRELDLVLTHLLDAVYPTLAASAARDFELLLDHPDQDILAWLTGQQRPPADLEALIGALRPHLSSACE